MQNSIKQVLMKNPLIWHAQQTRSVLFSQELFKTNKLNVYPLDSAGYSSLRWGVHVFRHLELEESPWDVIELINL